MPPQTGMKASSPTFSSRIACRRMTKESPPMGALCHRRTKWSAAQIRPLMTNVTPAYYLRGSMGLIEIRIPA